MRRYGVGIGAFAGYDGGHRQPQRWRQVFVARPVCDPVQILEVEAERPILEGDAVARPLLMRHAAVEPSGEPISSGVNRPGGIHLVAAPTPDRFPSLGLRRRPPTALDGRALGIARRGPHLPSMRPSATDRATPRGGKSMTTSKTIAALLGPTLVATAVMVLANLETMPGMMEEMSRIPMIIVLSGYAAFVPGLAIVYFHNRWSGGWPVLVTLFGWLSLVIGLIRMTIPVQLAGVMLKAGPSLPVVLPIVGVVFLLIGGFLSFKGYGRDYDGRNPKRS